MSKTKYYNGPGGVFIHLKENYLFHLEETALSIYDIKKNEIVGKRYNIYSPKLKMKNLGIFNFDNKIIQRLGEL